MTLLEFTGCALVAYSPVLSMVTLTVMNDPIKIIILICSGFFWLIAFEFSSFVWFILPNKNIILVHVMISVLIQEGFRFGTYKMIYGIENKLHNVLGFQTNIFPDNRLIAYISGLAFGITHGLFSYINVLAQLTGPGTIHFEDGSEGVASFSAVITACFTCLHVAWGVIFFEALDNSTKFGIRYVILTHLFLSCITVFHIHGYYVVPLVTIVLATIFSLFLSFFIAGGSFKLLLSRNRN